MTLEVYDYLYELVDKNSDGVIAGTESLNSDTAPTMGGCSPQGGNKRDLIIKCVNGVYRIWMDSFAQFTCEYCNKFCRFLDTRSSEDEVIIYTGALLESEIVLDTPSILSTIMATRCKLTVIASGPSSAFETAMYCFAKNREIRKYGYLTFGRPAYIKKYYKEWEHINRMIFSKAIELGILTTEQVEELLTYNSTMVIGYNDLIK